MTRPRIQIMFNAFDKRIINEPFVFSGEAKVFKKYVFLKCPENGFIHLKATRCEFISMSNACLDKCWIF